MYSPPETQQQMNFFIRVERTGEVMNVIRAQAGTEAAPLEFKVNTDLNTNKRISVLAEVLQVFGKAPYVNV